MNAQLDSSPAVESTELSRLIQAAKDALSDDIVTRLAETTGDGIDLLDRVNRSGVVNALPHIAAMANNGDLERLVDLARVYGSAVDALTDDMVSRLSDALGGGLDLLDQVNRANLAKALPVITRMVHTGDLERLADLARLVGSAQDALTDDMVSHLADAIGGGLLLLDRLQRGSGDRLINMLDRLDRAGTLEKLADSLPALVDKMEMLEGLLNCLEKSSKEAMSSSSSRGGLGGILSIVRKKENQESLHYLLTLARNMQKECVR